jgi:alkylhydroperoxidase family enzyme
MPESQPTPRVAALEAPYAPDVQASLEAMMPNGRGLEPLALFRTFARDLPLARAIHPLGRFMLTGRQSGGAAFDLRTRELVIDRVTARCGCEYEWGVHVTGYGAKAGLDEAQVHSIVHGDGDDACWSAKDAAVIRMVDALHETSELDDALFDALREHFDEDQIGELLILVGWYHAISYFANGMRTLREPWAARFPRP